jgi:hypothetical protein
MKTGIAAVALTALGLVAAAPASAHTNNMYTYVIYNDMSEQAGFATYGKADGVATPLATTFVPEMLYVAGIEVAAEKGTYLGYRDGPYVRTWNHTTGERGVEVAAYLNAGVPAELDDIVGLDTLNDGTTITIVNYFTEEGPVEFPEDVEHWAIASVNTGTGELLTLVELDSELQGEGAEFFLVPTSLATDPATGLTHVFVSGPEGSLGFLTVNVATGEFVGVPTPFENEYFIAGEVGGVDFDQATGELYFNYENDAEGEEYQLLKFTSGPSTWNTAEPTYISAAAANEDDIAQLALTIEYTALAATGSELPVLAIVLVGTVAVLAGGVTVMAARRRADAGTV